MKELIWGTGVCGNCGHSLSDHHKAGMGKRYGDTPNVKYKRDHCIGDGDRCGCRDLQEIGHARGKPMVSGGLTR